MSAPPAQTMLQYLELKAVKISDYQRASKFCVIVTHESGAREEFKTAERARDAVVTCHTFLLLPSTRATLQVLRKDKKQKNGGPAVNLSSIFGPKGQPDPKISFPTEYGMSVTLELGAVITATEVADARLKEALRALDSKQEMMNILEIGTKQLSLLSQVGEALSELNSAAKAITKIATIFLERATDIPASHGKLVKLALELVEQLESSRVANEVFSSEHVRRALEKFVDLMIRTAKEIGNCYSKPKWIVFMNEWASPRRESILELEKELAQHKGAISQAFLIEVRGGIAEVQLGVSDIKNGVDDVKDGVEEVNDGVKDIQDGVSTARIEVAAIHGDVQVLRRNADEERIDRLLAKLLPPADSRFYGKVACLEGTRMSVLNAISNWVRDKSIPEDAESHDARSVSSRLFWLHGVAGCGKSTVAASVCHMLASHLAGSFFCKRDQDSRRNGVRLFWALAFYLAKANVVFREQLLKPLQEVDTLLDLDLETQVDRILIQPLMGVVHNETSISALVVIDALDECSDSEKVAQNLTRVVESIPWIRFIVTSRDVPEIRDALIPLGGLKEQHDLFQYDAREDIRCYLRSQFQSRGPLAELHPYVDDDDVTSLVDKSQGLFIWIHTVVRFIAGTRIGKLDVLESILKVQGAAESESALDSIYCIVLENAAGSSTTSRNIVRLIIGLILITSVNEPLPPNALYTFLPADVSALRTEFDTILQLLSPVLIISDNGVRVYHTSFLDFSSHESRCGEAFYTSQHDLDTIMAAGCLEIMESGTRNRKRRFQADEGERTGLKFNICHLKTSFLPNAEVVDLEERKRAYISPELLYSSMFWLEHILHSGILAHREVEHRERISAMIKNLLCTDRALFWLEVMSITSKLTVARSVLIRIESSALPQIEDATLGMAAELRRFLDQFYSSIAMSAPHLYLSTLPWLSTSLKTLAAWQPNFPLGRILRDPIQQSPLMLHHVTCPSNVYTASISRDGGSFTACGEDGVVRVFDMHTGHIVWEQPTASDHRRAVMVASFSPAADILVSSHASTMCVWSTDSQDRSLKHLVDNNSGVYDLDFSKDGSQLATGSVDGLLRVWDVGSWTLKQPPMAGHESTITFVVFSPDGERIATASGDRTVRLWDTKTGSLIGSPMVGHTGIVWTLAFSPDGTTLASGSEDTTVILWDGFSGAMKGIPLQGHRWWVRSLVFTHDGRFVLSGSGDMSVRMWDARTGESFGAPLKEGILGFAPSFVLSPDGTRGVIASGARDVTVWDIPATVKKALPPGHSHHVFSVAFSPDDSVIASGGWDNCVFLWSREGKCLHASPMRHPSLVFFVRFSPDGKLLASGDQVGVTRIWDVKDGTLVREFKSHDWLNTAAWSPDGKKLAVAVERGPSSLRFWDPHTGQQLGEPFQGLTYAIKMLVYSPDGRSLASVCTDNAVRLWDVETCTQIGEPFIGHSEFAESVAFSPDGSKLVTGGWDSSLRMWDAATGQQLFDPVMHNGAVLSVAFSSDGKLVYSAGWDCCIHAWDSETGRPVGRSLKGHTQPINSISVSHDGRHIVSGGRDDAIRLWDSQAFFWEKAPSTHDLDCDLLGPDRVPENIPEDGWIRTAQGGLVLWVPTQYRGPLCDMSSLYISEDQENHPVRVRWDDICGGDSWERVRFSSV